MWKEFKAFIMRGNVLELAVGIIIGVAFGKIVSSFVADILTPIVSIALGRVDFANLFIALDKGIYPTLEEAKKAGVATINYGIFLNAVLDFLMVALAVFFIVKTVNRLKKDVPATVSTKQCPECLSMIPLNARKCAFCGTNQVLSSPIRKDSGRGTDMTQ